MGIFRKVFESKEARTKRIAMDRWRIINRLREGPALIIIRQPPDPSFGYGHGEALADIVNSMTEYLKEEPDDAPIKFLELFLYTLSMRLAKDFISPESAKQSAMTPALGLVLIRKYPNCAETAFTLIDGEIERLSRPLVVREGYSEIGELMRIYETFWETFVDRGFGSPWDPLGPELIRKFLSKTTTR